MGKLCKLMRQHTVETCLVLSVLFAVSVVVCISIGPVKISPKMVWQVIGNRLLGAGDISQIPENVVNIVWHLRMPRVVLGALVGISLSLSGVAMQAFTKNPLASPYVLGISSGASLGAVLAMSTNLLAVFGSRSVQAGAFLGSLLSILLVYYLAKSGNQIAPVQLVLVGMAVSAMFTAFSNFVVYKTPDDRQVRNITFWMLGSLAGSEWRDIWPLVLVLPPSILILLGMSRSLNGMMMGEDSAITLGIDVTKARKLTILAAALMTGTSVAVVGSIGFVGLVIPHTVRLMVGADHKRVISISIFLGAIFMMWVDVGARMLEAPGELPIGILTSMVGAPLFLWLLKTRRYSFGNKS